MKIGSYPQKLFFLLFSFACIYILIPTQNSSIDAWAYAGNIKYSEDLLKAHHLLYSIFGWSIYQIVNLTGFTMDILAFMKVINAVSAVLGLWIFSKILKRLLIEEDKIILYTLIVGSCFAWMRFATENETYIIPIVFSLIGTLSFLKFTQTDRKVSMIKSGFWLALACLFHQIHFVWWLGILIGLVIQKSSVKSYIAYILPALIVPLFYYPAVYIQYIEQPTLTQIIKYIFTDFYAGNITTSIGLENIYLTIINFIRSFIQLHGNIPLLIKHNFIFIIPVIISSILLLFSLRKLTLMQINISANFRLILVIIFLLHLTVAFLSVGNAEFMVMLPFLFVLIISVSYDITVLKLKYIASFLLVWNLSFGLIPNYYFSSNNYNKWLTRIEENKNALFIFEEKALVENQYYYKTGKKGLINLAYPPAVWEDKGKDPQYILNSINEYLDANFTVYVDDINAPEVLNRAHLLKSSNTNYYNEFEWIKTDSISTVYGTRFLHQIVKKQTTF